MSHLFQVVRHTFTLATGKAESTKVGQPGKRTKAQDLCDKYNEEESRWNLDGTALPLVIVSYTVQLVKTHSLPEEKSR
jgi:hypothetical protein